MKKIEKLGDPIYIDLSELDSEDLTLKERVGLLGLQISNVIVNAGAVEIKIDEIIEHINKLQEN